MNTRWQQGLSDASTTLEAAPWLAAKTKEEGVRVFDVMHDILLGQALTTARPSAADVAHLPAARANSNWPDTTLRKNLS
jgi:NTE family protein